MVLGVVGLVLSEEELLSVAFWGGFGWVLGSIGRLSDGRRGLSWSVGQTVVGGYVSDVVGLVLSEEEEEEVEAVVGLAEDCLMCSIIFEVPTNCGLEDAEE